MNGHDPVAAAKARSIARLGVPVRQVLVDATPAERQPEGGRALQWAYGVTTVPSRRGDLLPRTLAFLSAAGFDRPRLFVDGCDPACAGEYEREFGLPVTARNPVIRIAGNWWLTLWELYLREPLADRYAVFQDDLVMVRNARQYLEACPYPEKGYLNLHTYRVNQALAPRDPTGRRSQAVGWYPSNQQGKGALALVFSHAAVVELLTARHMVDRARDPHRGWRAIDGGVVDSMKKAGWLEYVHNPSLVQHTGTLATTTKRPQATLATADQFPAHRWNGHEQAMSFPGERFDAMTLLRTEALR